MNKESLNNFLYVLAAVAVIALGIYLFATQHVVPKNVTQIRWSVDNNPMRKIVIDYFEDLYPNIHVVNDPQADMQTILTQLAGDVPPDIITAYDIESFRRFQRLDQLEDLTPYVQKYNMPVNNIRKSLHEFVYIRDEKDGQEKVYGIPENCAPFQLFYNKDVFDRFGVPYPTNDMTWDEVLEVAKKLTSDKNVNGRKVVDTKGLMVSEDVEYWVKMYGGKLFSEDGTRCLINTPESRKGLEYLESLRMKDKVIPSASDAAAMAPTGGWGGANLLLVQGKVGMLQVGRYMIIEFRKYYPQGVRLGMVRCPKSPCPANLCYSKTYCIPKSCRHKEEAAKFLSIILSNENQKNITNYGDGWPSVDNPELYKIASFNPKYPDEDNNVELMKDIEESYTKEVFKLINSTDFMSIWNMEVDKVWLGEQSMAQACANTEKRVNKIIDRNIKNPNFLN
ncbi:MAG: sugar ABC transporter substrate-binding protein [Abditibacteriota bacterium]|nr:sugar ABC transporter substrate-binding protein [Abditibacteriota bacterium]